MVYLFIINQFIGFFLPSEKMKDKSKSYKYESTSKWILLKLEVNLTVKN